MRIASTHKKLHPITVVPVLTYWAIASAMAVPSTSVDADAEIREALEEVAADCPESYPEVDVRLPEPGGFADKSEEELLRMLDVWNPALRASVVRELGTRDGEAIPALVRALESDRPSHRLGALDALARMVGHQLANWREFRPDESRQRQAQESIRGEFGDLLLERVLSMADDPDVAVRGGVLTMLSALQARGPAVSRVVLRLGSDEDEFLADTACRLLDREFGFGGLDPEEVLPYLRRAMRNPLPRGKGHLVHLVGRSDESLRRAMVPDFLAHLDWQPERDTMFGAGGQARSIEILTELRVDDLLPRIPALMDKPMRGPGLFDDCIAALKAFGADARPVVPALREKLDEMRAELDSLADQNDRGSRARAGQLTDRIEALEETLNHVES